MTYTILLLIDDEVRKQQKAEIIQWIKREDFNNPTDLQRKTRYIISQLAQSFAQNKKSFELASGLLWRLKNK
jgi:hypothetical protein